MTRIIRRYLACKALARMVEEKRNSFEIRDYTKRRAAALKGRATASRQPAGGLRPEPLRVSAKGAHQAQGRERC
jgi:hypothetical protein